MGVDQEISNLESRIKTLLKKRKEDAAVLVLDNISKVVSLTEKIIPEKAVNELKIKFRYGWPDGSGTFYSDDDHKHKKAVLEDRYGSERDLLRARHPKRIKKLWGELKSKLEERYHRSFDCREDLAMMNGLFENRIKLEEEIENLKESLSRIDKFKKIAEEFPNDCWKDVISLWKEYDLDRIINRCASQLVGLIKDIKRPVAIIKEAHHQSIGDGPWRKIEYNLSDLTFTEGHKGLSDYFNTNHDYYPSALEYLTTILIEGKTGKLSFGKALDLIAPEYAKQVKINTKHPYVEDRIDFPDSVQKTLDQILQNHYKNRKKGDECTKFIKWFSNKILERWKATAIDHDKLFYYHVPNKRDKKLISLFYEIRDGKKPERDDERIYIDRLPGVLRLLVEDSVIKSNQIDPLLKITYLKPSDIQNKKSLESLISLSITKNPGVMVTEPEIKMISWPREKENLPALVDDLSGLATILDTQKDYYVLFKGDHTLFIATEHYFPSGSRAIGEIYRLGLLKENAEPYEGAIITIKGKRFNVKKEKAFELEQSLGKAIVNINSDMVPIRSLSVVTDVSPEQFRIKYFKDFMAHALIHGPWLGLEEIIEGLGNIDHMNTTDLFIQLGHTGKVYLETFELADKFGFRLKNKDEHGHEEVPFISKTLLDYLKEVGIGIHIESDIDEEGRNIIEKKKEEREFQQEHIKDVINALQNDGLVKILSYLLTDKRYKFSYFGESRKSCEYCNQKYIQGGIYRPDLGEQYFSSVDGKDLHDLARHPLTFVNKFDNLRKIYRIFSDAKNYTPPFIEHPEIMPEFNAFARVYDDCLKAGGEAYNFWESTCGGINAEDEELENSPKLRKLKNEEMELNFRERKLEADVHKATKVLQKKYDDIRSQKTKRGVPLWKITNFWADQVMIFNIYQVTAPKLLTYSSEQELMKNPVRLYRN